MSDSFLGPLVYLVRTDFDGYVETKVLPVMEALEALYDPDNGLIWYSLRIVADDVDMGLWERSA